MRLVTFNVGGKDAIGLVKGDQVIDLTKLDKQFDCTMIDLLAGGRARFEQVGKVAHGVHGHFSLSEVKLAAPILRPRKFLALGLNYESHIQEAAAKGVEIPKHQFWFNKQVTCVNGPYDPIVKPWISDAVDYEAELAFVIGETCRHVKAERAEDVIAGYMICNDVSVRDYQRHSPTFTMGKSFDTHGPIGPWIVTSDELSDANSLDVRCWVNGDLRQSANTSEFRYSCGEMIAYLSSAFTLEPGDIITTGTPSGVGFAMDPPSFLKVGDTVKIEIDGIGHIENKVVAE